MDRTDGGRKGGGEDGRKRGGEGRETNEKGKKIKERERRKQIKITAKVIFLMVCVKTNLPTVIYTSEYI